MLEPLPAKGSTDWYPHYTSMHDSIAAGASGIEITVAASNAPDTVKDRSDFICSGSNDQDTINDAIDATAVGTLQGSGIGVVHGTVRLSPGLFTVSEPIGMRNRSTLTGCGHGTQIEPTSGNTDAVISLRDPGAVGVELAHIAIYGRSRNCHGVHFAQDNAQLTGHDMFGSDAGHFFRFLRVQRCGSTSNPKDGIFLEGLGGSGGRGTKLLGCVVRHYSRHGIHISAYSDPMLTMCAGGTGVDGSLDMFHVSTGNGELTNCSTAYAGRDGYHLTSSRAKLTGCKSQDSGRDGYRVEGAQATLTSCYADSNGRLQAGDGFRLAASYLSLSGCSAFDRNQTPSSRQQYGFRRVAGNHHLVQGFAFGNEAGTAIGFDSGTGHFARVVGDGGGLSVGT